MQKGESARLWSVPELGGLSLLRANYITHAFKPHMHEHFVIGMVEEGIQRFALERDRYTTPPKGVIVINPGEVHDGESATAQGFRYRALYPDAALLERIATDVHHRAHDVPYFLTHVIDDDALYEEMHALHTALERPVTALELESRLLMALAHLILRHGSRLAVDQPPRRERGEVRRLRAWLDERYAEDVRLDDLAALVGWNPYYLLRVFRREVGLPPHAYQETRRIDHAQRLLRHGLPIVDVAYATGFSSQSHFTVAFRRLVGVTPGQYVDRSIS